MNLTITAVHINHMIRREAVDDQKFVQDLCGQLSILCKIFEIDVKQIAKREKMSLEEAGRKARYDAFAKTMKNIMLIRLRSHIIKMIRQKHFYIEW